jgi:hypothetical protein
MSLKNRKRIILKSLEKFEAAIGVLLLEGDGSKYDKNRPGLMTSTKTFDFPVIGEVVKGASPKRVIVDGDLTLTPHFVEAAKKLEQHGVKAIAGDCGFMALFQMEISRAVSIPVFSSSLILVPLVYRMLRENQKVGILTFNSGYISDKHFRGVGWSSKDFPVSVLGVEEMESWRIWEIEKWDFKQMEIDLLRLVKEFIQNNPDIGAIVLECTLMPPYASSIQKATGVPVFDITTLTRMVHEGTRQVAPKAI